VILILLEPLISGPRIDGERHGCVHGNALEAYRHGGESKINSDVGIAVADGDRF